MVTIDDPFETVLALAGVGLVVNVAFAVLVWLYAILFVGGSPVGLVLGAVFVLFGTSIVVAFVRTYVG